MSITINGATNTITAPSGLAIAGNTAVTGALGVTGALTGAAGSFTTLSASGVLTLGTTGAADTQLRSGALDANSSYFQSISADGTTAKNFKWYVGATDVMNLSSTALTLGTGVNLVMASGKGIDFSATANGSGTTTSEVLSDYEEGTWTPTFTGFSVDPTATGTYTKVGRQVTVKLRTTALGTSNSTGFAIGGLPYACGITEQGQICQAADNGVNGIAIAYINATETSVALYFGAGAANWTASGNKAAYFTITYFV